MTIDSIALVSDNSLIQTLYDKRFEVGNLNIKKWKLKFRENSFIA